MQNDKSKSKIFEELERNLPGIQKNIALKKYTTFRIGGKAKFFYKAKTKEDLVKAILLARKIKLPFFIWGGGSNILVSDEGYKGLVINFQFSIFNFQNSKIITGAGTPLGKIVNVSAEKGLTGLEWAAGIPGTVGGAIYGNAGAFGKSMADITKAVTVLEVKNQKLKIKNFKNRDCKFGYRESVFKHKKNLIILSAILELKKGNKKEIQEKTREYLNYRRKTQPLSFKSAGSIFKNFSPRRNEVSSAGPALKAALKKIGGNGLIPAGFLIEKCGLKGKQIGNVKISDIHANFIVNLGKGRAKDVKRLIDLTKSKVKNKFGIKLEEEIQYL